MAEERGVQFLSFTRALVKSYGIFILLLLGFAPAFVIAYLYFFHGNDYYFEHHLVHEIAISFSILQSAFIAYVTYLCFRKTQELFLLFLTLAFLGFTIVYAMHGVFTRLSQEHLMVFILYGPGSRFVMACFLLAGLIYYGRTSTPLSMVKRPFYWFVWAVIFVILNLSLYQLAVSEWASLSRWVMEVSALVIMLICAGMIVIRRLNSSLMIIYALSLLFFAQSSVAFLLASAWDHLWWFAHLCFSAGFMMLSFGVIQAFLTTGSFHEVYSQAELMEKLQKEKLRAESTLVELERAYEALAISASKDSLTGCANRREFENQGKLEIERAKRSRFPLSFLVLDLDNFKQINDQYGHSIGDEVIKTFAELVEKVLRPSDVFGRVGGEEFALVLPGTTSESAVVVAERIRANSEVKVVKTAEGIISFTVSIGVASFGVDGDNYKSLMITADDRMYSAKREGRNRVISTSGSRKI
ncbi:GGDEF domain-containing protein [Pseudidiomarina sp. E22-M8]|uniref:GGDEF domain-containing protein n=1 Tax=Pseudidiomarina sp. E22-M8 TaxID=3424768 RepID=UPI00403D13B2